MCTDRRLHAEAEPPYIATTHNYLDGPATVAMSSQDSDTLARQRCGESLFLGHLFAWWSRVLQPPWPS